MGRIYLDANATLPLLSEVRRGLPDLLEKLGNPSSVHHEGQVARSLLEEAREEIKTLIGDSAGEFRIVFNSGATEGNNTAFYIATAFRQPKPISEEGTFHIVLSGVEHPSVQLVAEQYALQGYSVGYVAPKPRGEFFAEEFAAKVGPETLVVAVVWANNETGEILPIAEIAERVKAKNPRVHLHCDGAQMLGKVAFSLAEPALQQLDSISFSGHKIGALSGVGALVLNRRVKPLALMLGGSQEARYRAGTENVLGIVSFGLTAKVLNQRGNELRKGMKEGRERLFSLLSGLGWPIVLNSFSERTLPNTLNIQFRGVPAADLLVALDLNQISISAGAACSSGKPEPSRTLLAWGLSAQEALESVRFSVGYEFLAADEARLREVLPGVLQRFK